MAATHIDCACYNWECEALSKNSATCCVSVLATRRRCKKRIKNFVEFKEAIFFRNISEGKALKSEYDKLTNKNKGT